jgi:integrase
MGSLYRPKKTKKLGERKGSGGSKYWWMKYRGIDGRVVRESSGTTTEWKAKRILATRMAEVERGDWLPKPKNLISFTEAAQAVVADHKVKGRRSVDAVERRLKLHLTKAFGRLRLVAITKDVIDGYILDRKKEKASNATINRELSLLKRAFSLAFAAEKITKKPTITLLPEDNVRQGFMEPAQFDAIAANLPAPVATAARFAYLTGWRIKSEVLTLEWPCVDFEAGVVLLKGKHSKNGEPRTFPFSTYKPLLDLLRAQEAERDRLKEAGTITPLVFHRKGKAIKDFRKAWETACTEAGYPARIPHDMRRSAVNNLVRAGVAEKTAMLLTGHKTRSVFERYHIVTEADKVAAVTKLGTLLGTPEAKTASTATVHQMPKSA